MESVVDAGLLRSSVASVAVDADFVDGNLSYNKRTSLINTLSNSSLYTI